MHVPLEPSQTVPAAPGIAPAFWQVLAAESHPHAGNPVPIKLDTEQQTSVVVVVIVVVVVDCPAVVVVIRVTVVVVVVFVVHPPAPHAAQQLETVPAQAPPCLGARQRAALDLIVHRVLPCLFVRQQVTKPGLPQVDMAAHFTTAPVHCFGSVPVFTAPFVWWATHETYAP